MPLRYDDIGEILKIIDSSSCEELRLETNEIKLFVRKRGANGAAPALTAPSAEQAYTSAAVANPVPHQPAAMGPAGDQQSPGVVPAPMVGTFYRSPSPEAPPFVEVGSTVKKGDPLCIIEVMKLFTTVHAEWNGRVVEIGAESATLVEYGQTLFVIEPETSSAACNQSIGGSSD